MEGVHGYNINVVNTLPFVNTSHRRCTKHGHNNNFVNTFSFVSTSHRTYIIRNHQFCECFPICEHFLSYWKCIKTLRALPFVKLTYNWIKLSYLWTFLILVEHNYENTFPLYRTCTQNNFANTHDQSHRACTYNIYSVNIKSRLYRLSSGSHRGKSCTECMMYLIMDLNLNWSSYAFLSYAHSDMRQG